jgi:hypothetical protein
MGGIGLCADAPYRDTLHEAAKRFKLALTHMAVQHVGRIRVCNQSQQAFLCRQRFDDRRGVHGSLAQDIHARKRYGSVCKMQRLAGQGKAAFVVVRREGRKSVG